MSDLIRRKDAVELLKNDIENNGVPLDDEYNIGIDHAMCLLACVPTAEPKVGRWIIRDETKTLNESYTCDQCGYIQWFPKVRFFDDPKRVLNYCPNCGAKMERSE